MSLQGNLEAAADGGRLPFGVPPRRRRRVPEARELATPFAASFLGLLLVHGLSSADAAELHPAAGAASEPETLPHHDAAGVEAAAAIALPAATVPTLALSSHGPANLIDASTLTRLTGETAYVTAPHQAVAGSSGGTTLPAAAISPTVAPVDLVMAHTGFELPSFAIHDSGSESGAQDEVVGPIGRYVQGDGTDRTVVLTDADDTFIGSDGNEHVIGGGGDDYLDGAGGDDHLEGGSGNDVLLGGTGNDVLEGGSGDDRLDGGLGDDILAGGSGDDHLLGGGGNDQLDGGTGTDVLEGGTGRDILVLADIRDAVTELGLGSDGGGNDTLVVAEGYGRSLAQALPNTHGEATFVLGRPDLATFPHGFAAFRQQIDPDIENIRLEGHYDHDVVGDGRDSIIVGNDGDNQIFGGGGEDQIWGGAGDDWLDGGDGADMLYGGAGDDTFVLGLHEAGDQVFDHEGHNTLRLIGADPDQLSAVMQGDDLVLTHGDLTVATVHDYAQHADNFVGIDLGHGVRGIDDFMAHPVARVMAQGAAGDWLADYLPAGGEAQPLAEPWSTMVADNGDDGSPDSDPAAGPSGDEPLAIAGQAPSDPLPDASFAADPVAGGEDLWLPVNPTTASGLGETGDDAAMTQAEDQRHHTG